MTGNYISTQLEISEDKAQVDTHVKNVLAARPFLAWIIKATVHEVREYSIEEIEDMIEGEPHIGVEPVDPGMTNHPKITGINTEDNVPFEGVNYYDVLTYIRIPDIPFPVKIIINIEGQADTSPGYDLVTRGVYYGARRISAQKNTEFTGSNYDDIKKVYSIWICFDSRTDERNTITEYSISKKNIVGLMPDRERYDLISVVFIRLGGDIADYATQSAQKLLMTIFSENLSFEQKRNTITTEFGIDMTNDEESEVRTVCNYSDGIERRALKRGEEKGAITKAVSIVDNLTALEGISLERSCELAGITSEEYFANKQHSSSDK